MEHGVDLEYELVRKKVYNLEVRPEFEPYQWILFRNKIHPLVRLKSVMPECFFLF